MQTSMPSWHRCLGVLHVHVFFYGRDWHRQFGYVFSLRWNERRAQISKYYLLRIMIQQSTNIRLSCEWFYNKLHENARRRYSMEPRPIRFGFNENIFMRISDEGHYGAKYRECDFYFKFMIKPCTAKKLSPYGILITTKTKKNNLSVTFSIFEIIGKQNKTPPIKLFVETFSK